MDSQELNRACELAFLVAREGVEQDPPIDPPASMRMFLYVRQFPQRALTVARQVMSEDEDFRASVAAAATEENVGAPALEWLRGDAELSEEQTAEADSAENADSDNSDSSVAAGATGVTVAGATAARAIVPRAQSTADTEPVTKESIRSEMDELKSLVGQLSDERAAVDTEVDGLAGRLEDSESDVGLSSALASATASTAGTSARGSASLTAQIRSLHTDLKQARSDRDHAQESKELAILEHAELAEELENLRNLAGSARVQLTDLEARVDAVSSEKDQLASEKDQISAEREALSLDKDSLSAEVKAAEEKLAQSEQKLADATENLEGLTSELQSARSNAGASVDELQAAVSARAAMESHVDALGGAHAKARSEMERVNTALSDRGASDQQKIETLKVALASVTAERDALHAKLETVRATVNSLQGEMAKLDSNFSDAESVATVLSERMEELQSSVDELPSEQVVAGDMAQFDTPDTPQIPEHTPTAFAVVDTSDDIDTVSNEVSEIVSGFDNDAEIDASNDWSGEEVTTDDASVEALVAEELVAEQVVVDESAAEAFVVEDIVAGEVVAGEVEELSSGANDPEDDAADESDFEFSFGALAEDEGTAAVEEVEVPTMLDEAPGSSFAASALAASGIAAGGAALAGSAGDAEVTELVPEEILPVTDGHENSLKEAVAESNAVSPLVMSDTTEEFTDAADFIQSAEVEDGSDAEDIDEVHALVAETVASFEPTDSDSLPGTAVPAEQAAEAGASADRGGITSLFSTFVPGSDTEEEGGEGMATGLLATAGVGAVAAGVASNVATDGGLEETMEMPSDLVETAVAPRGPIAVPEEISADPLATARHIVNTENAVLLVDGDPVAAMGWPSVDRVEQRRNLVHYLSVMAGTSGASPDVLLDRDFGIDRLPDSRSVRVRVTNESGSVSAQIVTLVDSYPSEWPVVVVTDNMDLAAEAAMKGATLLDNGQLLDLFIAP